MTMMPPIALGSPVRMSALGAERCPRIADKKGVIVGEGRYSNSLRVLLNGSKSPVSLHRDYIERDYIEQIPSVQNEMFASATETLSES
jgi:hypothetical protein